MYHEGPRVDPRNFSWGTTIFLGSCFLERKNSVKRQESSQQQTTKSICKASILWTRQAGPPALGPIDGVILLLPFSYCSPRSACLLHPSVFALAQVLLWLLKAGCWWSHWVTCTHLLIPPPPARVHFPIYGIEMTILRKLYRMEGTLHRT